MKNYHIIESLHPSLVYNLPKKKVIITGAKRRAVTNYLEVNPKFGLNEFGSVQVLIPINDQRGFICRYKNDMLIYYVIVTYEFSDKGHPVITLEIDPTENIFEPTPILYIKELNSYEGFATNCGISWTSRGLRIRNISSNYKIK